MPEICVDASLPLHGNAYTSVLVMPAAWKAFRFATAWVSTVPVECSERVIAKVRPPCAMHDATLELTGSETSTPALQVSGIGKR